MIVVGSQQYTTNTLVQVLGGMTPSFGLYLKKIRDNIYPTLVLR